MIMLRRNVRALVLAACLAGAPLLLAGCIPASGEKNAEAPAAVSTEGHTTWEGLEMGALPERFGYGREATPAEIAALDIDVAPDGTGLPAGHGTVADGAVIYAAQCAACHGVQGEGTELGDRLVGRDPLTETGWGRTIGNYWPYAPTVFDYIRRAMPFDRPGTLSDDEVYAVTAFLLYRNEIIPENSMMDARTLPQVEMPARDRFVPDDRETSSRVR